jgi:hypothetical protein
MSGLQEEGGLQGRRCVAPPTPPTFKEALPLSTNGASCPPSEAKQPTEQWVLRLVPDQIVRSSDFLSHHGLGKKRPSSIDPCRWASCSVFRDTKPLTELQALCKLPNLAHMKFVLKMKIRETSGVILPGPKGHIDFWQYAEFDPLTDCTIHAELG